ncbi:hypothetical protein [Aliarcobacter skirrowii]|uniref:hypothetical protein n=1 Tax=Aliarcobacter skirrowii TaxID=28200 RepID=UPI0021B32BA7|nr:hypothetical protein [Aliarcobacter skirrowii]MCT7447217.1 hypothetical protein [Aliarcobacter skirrowii]
MNVVDGIDTKISGLYDIGKEFVLDIYFKTEEDKENFRAILPKKKTITISEHEGGIRLRSFNLGDLINFQKRNKLNFKLEHL